MEVPHNSIDHFNNIKRCSEHSTTKLTEYNTAYPLMLQNFVYQRGDKGAKLLAELSQYIEICAYKNVPIKTEDQEDILQEVLIKVLNNHQKIKTNTRGWLFRIVSNECANWQNKISSRKKLIEVYSKNKIIKYKNNDGMIMVWSDAINDYECLEYAFKNVTDSRSGENDREILQQYAAGFENKEIAENTGRPSNAINKKLSVLKKRIRQFILEYC